MKEALEKMYVQALRDDLPPNVFADQVLRLFNISGSLSQQSEIVRQRLHYHFATVGGGWNVEGMNAPFMNEFLNEVQKLVDLFAVVGRSEQYHCELYDFGRREKPCDKQCDGCKEMNLD